MLGERKQRLKGRVEAALDEGEHGRIEEVAYAFVGPGLWPFVVGAAVIAALVSTIGFRTGVELGIWSSVVYAVVFGAAYLVWMLLARPHFVVLTRDALLLVRSSLWSVSPAGIARAERRAVLRPGVFKPGWAWGRLDLVPDGGRSFRLNFPRAWAEEMRAMHDALSADRSSATD